MAGSTWEVRRASIGQKQVNILLCDDDPGFLGALEQEIRRIFAKLNMNAALFPFHRPGDIPGALMEECDIAFLDIDFEQEEYNGIDIARRIRQKNRHGLVFFVTNFIEYAPAGYEVQAFRYVLKRDMGEVLERYILSAMDQFAQEQEYLRLQTRDEQMEIPLEQISYLEVMDHCVSVHTGSGCWELNAVLSRLEEELAGHGFLRIHKSYLVNMGHIRKLRSRECLLSDGTVLAVSERNYGQQKQKYLLWKGMK